MSVLLRFRPKPRCLRDKLEVWIIRKADGALQVFNLAGLIPYILFVLGLIIGLIVSFALNPDTQLKWDSPVRFMPILLGPGGGVFLGVMIRYAIVLHHYEDYEYSEAEIEAAQQFAARADKPQKKKSSKRRRRVVEDD